MPMPMTMFQSYYHFNGVIIVRDFKKFSVLICS